MLDAINLGRILARLQEIIDTEKASETFKIIETETPGLVEDFDDTDKMFLSLASTHKTDRGKLEDLQHKLLLVLSQIKQKTKKYFKEEINLIENTADFKMLAAAINNPMQLWQVYLAVHKKILLPPKTDKEIHDFFLEKSNASACTRMQYYCQYIMKDIEKKYLKTIEWVTRVIKIYNALRETQESFFKTNLWPLTLLNSTTNYVTLSYQLTRRAEQQPESRTAEAIRLANLPHNGSNTEDRLIRQIIRKGRERSILGSMRPGDPTEEEIQQVKTILSQ